MSENMDYNTAELIFYIFTILFYVLAVYIFCAISFYVIVMENIQQTKVKTVITTQSMTSQGNNNPPVRDNQGRTISIESISHIGKTKCNVRATRYKKIMLSLCILASAVTVIHFTLERFVIGRHDLAKPISLANKYIYGLIIIIVYLFFWIRQRLFYDGQSPLKHCQEQNKCLHAFSWISLVFVVLFSITQMALVAFWNNDNSTLVMSGYEALSWLVGCFFIQGQLLVLFVYPLWKLNKIRANFLRSRDSTIRVTSSNQSNLKHLIRRCIVFLSISFATDIISVVLAFLKSKENISDEFLYFAFDVNIVTNSLCLIGTFTNWKIALFPWIKFKRNCNKENERKKSIQSNITTIA